MDILTENKLNLKLRHQGKVRDVYQIDDKTLLFIATDRISAFDIVLPQPIVGKGAVLTALSHFWFDKTQHIIGNHRLPTKVSDVLPETKAQPLTERAMVVKNLKPLPIEAIVRGYLIGSGWLDYQKTQSVCGIDLPAGLQLAEKLPTAIYTPSTKAAVGDHDENISFEKTVDLVGKEMAEKVRATSLALYQFAADYALKRGIIIADTKFEFGLDEQGELLLMDEVLTPDSSRFWPKQDYQVGVNPPSFDKQAVRDYLVSSGWDKTPPPPPLPAHICQQTTEKYQQVQQLLCQ